LVVEHGDGDGADVVKVAEECSEAEFAWVLLGVSEEFVDRVEANGGFRGPAAGLEEGIDDVLDMWEVVRGVGEVVAKGVRDGTALSANGVGAVEDDAVGKKGGSDDVGVDTGMDTNGANAVEVLTGRDQRGRKQQKQKDGARRKQNSDIFAEECTELRPIERRGRRKGRTRKGGLGGGAVTR
jgi:hypothetical protein